MSILNALIRDDGAVVIVDTEGRDMVSGTRWHCSKMTALPAAPMVFAGRGCLGTFWAAATGLATTGGDFDGMAAALPALAHEAWTAIAAKAVAAGLPPGEADAEFLAVGWSAAHGAIVGQFCARTPTGWTLRTLRNAIHCAPWDASLGGPAPTASNAVQLGALVPRQLAYHGAVAPHIGCGGRMLVCRISRDAIAFLDHGTIAKATPS